jgi:hypothetical protein
MKGYKLTDEEFYLIAAMGAISGLGKGLGISPMTDAEAFAMMYYEDDSKRGYINPEEGPRVLGRVRLRFGIPPEEIRRSSLRPEQREFFARYVPSYYARFQV